jgi:DNA-directed RNA polymerase specialized sigma24 family protein
MNVQEATPLAERREGTHYRTGKAPSTDERWLVTQAKSGSSTAFGELYDRHRLRTYRTAFRILRNRQDAEDAVQRSFQRAFTNLCRFRGDSTFSTWVTRIAINEALMLLRQRRANTRLRENNDDTEATSVRELQGLTSAETAQRLGLTVSAVKARTFHARRCLRRHFEREYKLPSVAW